MLSRVYHRLIPIGFLLFWGNCATLDLNFLRMELFETFCLDCGKVDLNCEEILKNRDDLVADYFEFPVGSASGSGYYIAQTFGEENPRFRGRKHLGEDWNYKGGGDSDYAAPVYSIGVGLVTQVKEFAGGWGKVIRVCHRLSPSLQSNFGYRYMESIYAHLYDFQVEVGDPVGMGQWIGSIGDADGLYVAHLHFELRTAVGMELGGGYSSEIPEYYISPIKFLSYFQKRIAY